jgi:hypothetical protein
MRTASCACGGLSVAVQGEPSYFGACSCRACQKATGSVFSMSAYFPRSAVESIAGDHKLYRRRSDGGRWVDEHFCPTCGSMVFWYAEFDPESIGVSVGNFADPGFGPPQYAVWCETQHPWVRFPDSCQRFPRQPEL